MDIVSSHQRNNYNDKVLINSAVALAILKSFEKGAKIDDLFQESFGDFRVDLGYKLGLSIQSESMFGPMNEYLKEIFSEESGIVEVDCNDISEQRDPDEEIFRFDGALHAYGHILDMFVRKFFPTGEGKVCEQLAFFLVESQVFQTLNKEEDFSMTSKVF
jgi:hypothetical protein